MTRLATNLLDYGDNSDDDANPGIFLKKECLPLNDMGNRTNFAEN